jgi:hypothetical protein
MTIPIRASEATLIEVRQALQRIELWRRTAAQSTSKAAKPVGTTGTDDGVGTITGSNEDETEGYSVDSLWTDENTGHAWKCVDATTDAAIWVDLAYFGYGGIKIPVAIASGGTGAVIFTPSQFVRVNAGATALETFGKIIPTGEVVGTSDSQILSAKTLTTPTIPDFTNATHDHADAPGGGQLAYTPAVADNWEDTDPANVVGGLDRIAGGHAGVALISGVEPTVPATGQMWLDTSATGSAGSGILTVNTITADLTLTTSHRFIRCDASSGPIVVTLPAAASNAGRKYCVKKIDPSVNPVTIDTNASETIDGDATAVIVSQYEEVSVVSDGSNWDIGS